MLLRLSLLVKCVVEDSPIHSIHATGLNEPTQASPKEIWKVCLYHSCVECSAPRLDACTASCRTPCFAGTSPNMVVLSPSPQPWPSVCNLPPPLGATTFHLLTGHQLCGPRMETAFIARMSLLTSPLATDQWNTHFMAPCPLR